ncbi:helix-turn-helix domain-containing protein [Sphingobacterium lactis]|uniref:AraC family transcriptional regulator n=1 Tax=Sphingobacterium TaxID=28453 RepID=UPI0021A5FA13|nr:AraC family transcriptional regulator [Sphingobacterium hotanense]MCT1526062.1 AraC family transcriptional regulator [Sphingobacterium hotanense]
MGKEPYFFIYGKKPKYYRNVKGNLPTKCRYPLVNADSAELLGFECGSEFLIQRLDSHPFVVDLTQLNCKKPFNFGLGIEKPRLFLYFMIEGAVDFYTEDFIRISHSGTKRFYASFSKQGIYHVKPSASQNIALIITIKPGWAKKTCRNFPYLYEMVQRFEAGELSYEVLPQCLIDTTIRNHLEEMHTYSNENPGALNGTLRRCISLVLEHYDKSASEKEKSIAYQAKYYIDANFEDANVGIKSLASDLATTSKTLTKHFKYEFGFTPYAYLIQLRMTFARDLIETHGQKASDVYWQVGYDDVKSFRAQYRNFFGNRCTAIES